MATERERLEVEVVATDRASSVIRDVGREVDGLDGETAEVELTAEDKATEYVDELRKRCETLEADEYEVQLNAKASQAEAEIRRANRLLADYDGEDVDAILKVKDEATARLAAVRGELDLVRGAATNVNETIDPSDQSRSVFANFAGNAAQELPGVAGAFGPLNMAISQFTEYAAEGNVNMRSLAKFAGPIGLVAAALAVFAKRQGNLAENAEHDREQVDDFVESIVEYGDALETVLRNTDELVGRTGSTSLLGSLMGEEDATEIAAELGEIGLTLSDITPYMDSFIALNRSMGESGDPTAEALEAQRQALQDLQGQLVAAGVDQADAIRITEALEGVAVNYAEAATTAAGETKFYAETAESATDALKRFNSEADPMVDHGADIAAVYADMADGAVTTTEGVDALNRIVAAFGLDSPEDAYELVTEAIGDQEQAAEEAADAHREELTEALEGEIEALEELLELQTEWLDNQRSLLDLYRDQADAGLELAKIQEEYAEALEADDVDAQREAIDKYTDAALDAADTTVELSRAQATASGTTLSQTQSVDEWNRSMLTAAQSSQGPLRSAILNQIRLYNEIPTEVMTEIELALERGDVTEANRLINETSKPRNVAVSVDANQASIGRTKTQINALTAPTHLTVTAVLNAARAYQELANLRAAAQVAAAIYNYATGRRAAGDPMWSGGPVEAAEQGAEVAILPTRGVYDLPRGSKIVPNHRLDTLGLGGGGDTYNNTVVNNWPAGTSPREVEAAQRRYRQIQGSY